MAEPCAVSWDNPLAVISPPRLWRAALAGRERYVLIGDANHMQHDILRALTQSFDTLARFGVTGLGTECGYQGWGPLIERFNKASWWQRQTGEDMRELRAQLQRYSTPWDITEADRQSRRLLWKEQILTAREKGITLYPLNAISHTLTDYLPELDEAGKERFRRAQLHRGQKGSWPEEYLKAPLLRQLHTHFTELAQKRLLRANDELDFDRGMAMRSLSAQHPRLGVFFGAGHFASSAQLGLNTVLPVQEQVHVLITDGTTNDLLRNRKCLPPHFILRTDRQEGWVMPAAQHKGLWPA